MSMDDKNIKRNSLDYILTDLLPVEISELFSFYDFYNYLVDKHERVDQLVNTIVMLKNDVNQNISNNTGILFESNKWASMPLKFSIIKSSESIRELNIVQPVAALEIYLFISAFEKEILNYLGNNSMFSIRYHSKNNDLYYKQKKKNITQYFSELSDSLEKGIIQQTGMYFNIGPFRSIVDFTNSDKWFDLNLKYKYFAKLDYKSCFDSIYTHTYVWLVTKDVNDSIGFKNGNLFTTIDRIMQNINARTSNGIVVGPEFSRMIAEILLQGIDSIVFNILLNEGIILNANYCVCRYVDDFFIFAESEQILEKIIKYYNINAKKYMLQLNESKIVKEKLPFVLNPWLQQLSIYATELSNTLFYSKEERSNKDESVHAFKASMLYKRKSILKRNFNDLLCAFDSNTKTLVSYVLGTLLNKVSAPCGKYPLFRNDITDNTVREFLDYIFYIYSHFPSFDNTQRLISILSYINDEVDLSKKMRGVLQQIINHYAYLFESANINDVINLILLCAKCKVEIPYQYEMEILRKVEEEDNPIIWASYMIYAKYDAKYFQDTLDKIENIINIKMESILKEKNIFTYREFWWLLIYNKCPFISPKIQKTFDSIIQNEVKARCSKSSNPCDDCVELVTEYLLKSPKQFFEWDIEKRELLQQITYRTYQRTVFRNYKYGRIEYCSL